MLVVLLAASLYVAWLLWVVVRLVWLAMTFATSWVEQRTDLRWHDDVRSEGR